MFKKFRFIWLALIVLAFAASPAGAQTDNERFPVDWYLWNACAEETVHVQGTIHWVVQSMDDGNGGYHYRFHENRQNVTGEGLSSGAEYRVVGTGRNIYRFAGDGGATTLTEVSQTGFIAKGAADNSVLQVTWHLTFNPDGAVTAEVADRRLICQ